MLPKVVIVGRPNVGKSSLLNLLAGRRVSIVDPTAGVTRDRVAAVAEIPVSDGAGTRHVELIDTGGYGIVDAQDLAADVERQIERGVADANLILFVVDVQSGLLPLDHDIARLLRQRRRPEAPILVVANKVDGPSHEPEAHQAEQLGLGAPVPISANNAYLKHELLDAIAANIDWERYEGQSGAPDPGILLAIVGKRNAGKSTLVNALAGDQRVIVSEAEGTTRDSVDVRFEVEDHVFTAIDTAGVRKRKSMKEDIEYYSHHRALRSIRRADVVLFVVDATVPISQVDRQLVGEILKHHKPCVVVVNKWDLAEQAYTQEQYIEYFDDSLKGVSFAPVIFLSAQKGEGLRDLLAMALNLYRQAGHRVTTGELNRVMEAILQQRTPSSKLGKRPRIYYAAQLEVHPPTVGLFVNDPELFDPGYQRFLINRLRDQLPFSEVPIKLLIRPRKRMPRGAEAMGD